MKPSIDSTSDARGVIRVLAIGSFVRDLGQYIVWVIMAVFLNEVRNVSYIGVGLVFLVGGLISVPVSIYGGNLLDRLGRRSITVLLPWVLMVIYALLFLSVYLDFSTYMIIALFIAASPIQSIQYVGFTAIASDVTAPSERAGAFGILRIASNAGIGIGLVSGGILSELSYATVFLLPIAGSLVEGTLYYFRIPETSSEHIKNGKKRRKERLFIPWRDTLFITVSLLLAVGWFSSGMFESALTPLYLTSIDNFSNFMVTGLFAINTLVVLVAQAPINRWFFNYRDTTRIVMGLSLFASAYLVFAFTSDYFLLAIAVVILTTGENLGSPSSSALITKIAPEDRRGAYLGLYSSIGSLIVPFRPLAATALLAFTISAPYRTWVILSVATFIIVIILVALFGGARKSLEARMTSETTATEMTE